SLYGLACEVSNYQRQQEETDSKSDRQTLQEEIQAARLLLAEQMLGTARNRSGQPCTLPLLKKNDSNQSERENNQQNLHCDIHKFHLPGGASFVPVFLARSKTRPRKRQQQYCSITARPIQA